VARFSRTLLVLGSVLLLAGIIAGVGNHEVLDGSRFAAHADAIRKDPDVSRQAGIIISDRIIAADPDVAIARPLVESTATALVGSEAFGPAVRAMLTSVHEAFTSDGDDQLVLRLADVGAVLIAALRTVAPDAAAALPPDLDVTLAEFGENGFSSSAIGHAHLVKTLSWLLPLLALLCFAGAVLLFDDRTRAIRAVGLAIASTGLVLATAVFVGGVVASRVDTDTLPAALGVAGWNQLTPALWTSAAVVAAAGYVLVLGSVLRLGMEPRAYFLRAVGWLREPQATGPHRAARGAVLLAGGAAAVLSPVTTISVIVSAVGFVVGIDGAIELVRSVRRPDWLKRLLPRLLKRPEVRTALVAGAAFSILAALVVWNSRPPEQAVAAMGSSDSGLCNGHAELCDRRYNEVAYAGTHNSMSALDEPGWFLAEQPTGIIGQLDDGIHVLLIDTWPGQATSRPGIVATSEEDRAEAKKQAVDAYGASVVDSALRLRDATNLAPTGPVEPYLCHAMCELGSTAFEPVMAEVKTWMEGHPREVITLFIQDELSPAVTAEVLEEAGLLSLVYTPSGDGSWPTLGEMIDSGQRLVVLAENRGGGTTYPWLLQGFDEVQDTPYDATKASDFSCDRLRGPADAPLFLVNHWLNRPERRVSDAVQVNAASVLGPRLDECRKQRGHIPNFVAVDYYDKGALMSEVDRLNGVG
jgi:hypothetical protein